MRLSMVIGVMMCSFTGSIKASGAHLFEFRAALALARISPEGRYLLRELLPRFRSGTERPEVRRAHKILAGDQFRRKTGRSSRGKNHSD